MVGHRLPGLRLVDSNTYSYQLQKLRPGIAGMGIVALAAANAANAGEDWETVAAKAQEARRGLKMWFAVDTLEYLRRGGRIGGARA